MTPVTARSTGPPNQEPWTHAILLSLPHLYIPSVQSLLAPDVPQVSPFLFQMLPLPEFEPYFSPWLINSFRASLALSSLTSSNVSVRYSKIYFSKPQIQWQHSPYRVICLSLPSPASLPTTILRSFSALICLHCLLKAPFPLMPFNSYFPFWFLGRSSLPFSAESPVQLFLKTWCNHLLLL